MSGVGQGGLCGRAVWSRGLLPALLGSTFLIAASAAQAQDATWLAAPGSDDLTTDANWDTGVTPYLSTASFGPSTITTLTHPGFWWVGGMTLNADAANYTINSSGNFFIDGAGFIVNGGALTVNNFGIMLFFNSSTAGSATFVTKSGATINFLDSSLGGTSRQIIEAGGVVDITNLVTGATPFGSIEGAGTVKAGTYILTVGTNDLSTTFSGDISGTLARLVKVGTGTLTLTGSSHTYYGNTTVNGGTLAVNGSLTNSSEIIVNNTGTLGGTGTAPTVTINNGGALAPGNSIGTLNVNGNVTFNAGSTYNIEVSPSDADKTVATGTASLTGGTVQATYQAGTYLANNYTILTSAGLGGTTFAGLTNVSLPAGFSAALSYTATDVTLVLSAALSTLPGDGLTGNQQSVANALSNFFNNGGALPPGFVTLFGLTGNPLNSGLDQVSGQGGAGGIQTAFTATNLFMNAIAGDGGEGGEGGAIGYAGEAMAYAARRNDTRQARDAYAAVTPRDKRATFDGRWSVWASGYGGSGTVNGDSAAGTQSTTSRIFGTAVGADYRIGRETRIGFAMGGAGTTFNTSAGLGSGRADLFQLGLHARREFGPAYLAGAASFGWQDVTTNRTVTVAGTDRLEANFKAQTYAGRAEAGYRYATPWLGLTPYAAVQATSFHLPGYSEYATSGSSQFALAFASQTTTNVRSELGVRTDKSFLVRDGTFTLRGRAAWGHDSNTGRAMTATFQSLAGTSFTTNGARPSADAALLTAGAEMKWRNGFSLAGTFESEFSRTTQSYAGKGAVRYAW